MAVEDKHPQYLNKEYEMRQMRDTVDGVTCVKRAGSLYLPIPNSMTEAAVPPTGISNSSGQNGSFEGNAPKNEIQEAPYKHDIEAYSAYVQRARFPDITSLLVRGMTGIATKIPAKINLPDNISYLEDRATRDGKNLNELYRWMLSETLTIGRVILLLDVDTTNNELVIVPYVAESFINWKTEIDGDTGNEVLSLGVFEENAPAKDADEFSHDTTPANLVLRNTADIKGADGVVVPSVEVYATQKYLDGKADVEVIIPTLRGKPFPFPPIVSCGVSGVSFDFGTTPIVGVSDIAISIYQKEADMSQAEFLTCNPMLVTTGVTPEDTPDIVGSNVVWSLPDTESKAFYVEPKSNCLNHMRERIKDLMNESVQYGVAVLGSTSNTAEAADTIRMRQEGNSSNLRTIIQSCEEAINQILEYAYNWESNSQDGFPETESEDDDLGFGFHASLELAEMSLSPSEQQVLLQSYLNRAISHETFLLQLEKGGIELSSDDITEEINKISSADPTLLGGDSDDTGDGDGDGIAGE